MSNDALFSSLNLPTAQLSNLEQMGYQSMTEIQAKSLPLAIENHDLIAQAKTGSGKTAAFGISLLLKIEPRSFNVQSLIMCPTRELCTQVANEIRRLARYQQNIKVVVLCGGQSIGPQIGSLEHGAHVVVGTPGRLKDHLRKETLHLNHVQTLVLDEADRMLEMGFADDIEDIIGKTPAKRQTLMFSATYPDDIVKMSARFQKNPQKVSVESIHKGSLIEQHFYEVGSHGDKPDALIQLLGHFRPVSTVVFCNTKQQCNDLKHYLNQAGYKALALQGDMEQRDRDQVLVQFSNNSCNLLVATDVAARGLDIDDLSAVINYDLSREAATYIHRIGRTGRAGKSGLALSLSTQNEGRKLNAIGDASQQDIQLETLDSLAKNRSQPVEPHMVTLCIAGGRKDKIRPGDVLGALTGSAGIPGAQVGKINVFDFSTYVAVEREVARTAMARLQNGKIKNRKFKIRKL